MKELGIDIETYSSYDLASCGVYKYCSAKDFEILLFSYAVDNGDVITIDLASGEKLPPEILSALTDSDVIKTAFNAQFERVCLSRYFNAQFERTCLSRYILDGKSFLDPAQWSCTMVRASRLGFPLSLAACAEALGLEQKKMKEGKALIRFFSCPSKLRGVTRRRLAKDYPAQWDVYKSYNKQDVVVEQEILKMLKKYPTSEFDDKLYVIDQLINDRGVRIDRTLVENAAKFDETYKAELLEKAKELTGLDNPNSPAQIKRFIKSITGADIERLNKKDIEDLDEQFKFFPRVRKLLSIRAELGKTSNKKYSAMLSCVTEDDRIRGLLQFYGASRTGRWAGRLVQMQNLPQNHMKSLNYARDIVRGGDLEELEQNYANVTQVLSELIRTSFIPKEGCIYHVCDFSAIECRVIAWLAGENWVLDVFKNGGDIYCATASKMFGVPVEKHGINGELRQKGKIATLALGYGGGIAALEAMGAKRMGLSEKEERETVNLWRKSNKNIVRLWDTVEKAVLAAISTGEEKEINRGIKIKVQEKILSIVLPSGRPICYPYPCTREELCKQGVDDIISYCSTNQVTKKWELTDTYGGKLTENIVQAIARDILGVILLRASERSLDVVFHIHDEIIVEAKPGQTLQSVEALFSEPIAWCQDLPLKGAGYSTPYYLKD